MWFVASFTTMAWAAYATFCEPFTDEPNDGLIFLCPRRSKGRVLVFYAVPSTRVLWRFRLPFYTQLLFWRAVQAAGSSAGLSTGMAIIGDIYRLEERETAMGITFSVHFAIAPYGTQRLTAQHYLFLGHPCRTCRCSVDWGNRH